MKELGQRELRTFIRQAWPILEPATEFIGGWHIDCIAEHLEAITAGELQFLIVNIPPRYMKSLTVTVMWPVWEWGPRNLPWMRYLFNSYSGELSTKHSVDRRTLIESEWYQDLWGDRFKLTTDNNRKTEFENNLRGIMQTTSTGSSATGKGGQRLIIDDPVNPKQALSDTKRNEANTHFDQTLFTRLNDKRKDAIVVIMQRLHQGDLTGHLLAEKAEMGWTILKLPALAPKPTVISFPRSNRIIARAPDDVLWPDKEPRAVLDTTKLALGSYAWAGQYQQEPAPAEGGYIKRAWWKRCSREQLPAYPWDQLIVSTDAAFKDVVTGSKVAIQVWMSKGPNRYLLDRETRHMGFTDTIHTILKLRDRWDRPEHPVTATIIEDKANGPAIIEQLKKDVPGVIAIEPDGSKPARAMSVGPTVESGNVYIIDEPWGSEIIDYWAMVPVCNEWDDVDAASQALRYLAKYEIPADAPLIIVGTLRASEMDLSLGAARSFDW